MLCSHRLNRPLPQRRFFRDGEIIWSRPDGTPIQQEDWSNPLARALSVASRDGDFVLLINGWWEPLTFMIPTTLPHAPHTVAVDTCKSAEVPSRLTPGAQITREGRSLMLLTA